MRLALVSTILALAAIAATASPAAASLRSCGIGDAGSYGPSYVTSIAVAHVSCATGRRVVRAFQHCRMAHGIRGRCRHRVLHYSCSEHRGYGQGQFTGRVVCTRGNRRVRHTYTQFT